jgi:hypothetical protein
MVNVVPSFDPVIVAARTPDGIVEKDPVTLQ